VEKPSNSDLERRPIKRMTRGLHDRKSSGAAAAGLPHMIESLPILILSPHSRCNCRCVMCDIWKVATADEISVQELSRHVNDIAGLGVRWVVFSGGEPLMHSDLFRLAAVLQVRPVRTTILTTGLLLEANVARLADSIDDVIVSLDGPEEVHDRIRRIPRAFRQLQAGIRALRGHDPEYPIAGRCTVQRANCRHLCDTVTAARGLGLDSVSFLAADVASTAFHRPEGWPAARQAEVALPDDEIDVLRDEIEKVIDTFPVEIERGFIRESPEKLRRLADHFEAHLGRKEHVAPRCNAPWVSAVVETDGALRPCFFHAPIGNVRQQGLREALNNPTAVAFRASLDVTTNPICRRCTCSLYLSEEVL
jgi:MoaA/NifB/PqqE/SkfB family radical SAM enzyme